jgi:hypothetical protein
MALRMMAGPISGNGNTALHRPSFATAPGIPHTTLDSSS